MRGACFYPAQGAPILEGDEHYMYVSQTPITHHSDIPSNDEVANNTEFMLLTTPRDRWVG